MQIVYTTTDTVSMNAGSYLESKRQNNGSIKITVTDTSLLDFSCDADAKDPIIFLSKHVSSKNIRSFTVHSEGNWASEAKLGGKPNELSTAAPIPMFSVLKRMKSAAPKDMNVTYEATHHGPLLNVPSFFAEVGGDETTIKNKELAEFLADSVLEAIENPESPRKVVVGIGGNHYASKFTKLAIENDYAFSHIMPRYYVSETNVLRQAFERSVPKAESAVIEWKTLNSAERLNVLNELKKLGIEYEKT